MLNDQEATRPCGKSTGLRVWRAGFYFWSTTASCTILTYCTSTFLSVSESVGPSDSPAAFCVLWASEYLRPHCDFCLPACCHVSVCVMSVAACLDSGGEAEGPEVDPKYWIPLLYTFGWFTLSCLCLGFSVLFPALKKHGCWDMGIPLCSSEYTSCSRNCVNSFRHQEQHRKWGSGKKDDSVVSGVERGCSSMLKGKAGRTNSCKT